MIEGLKVIAFDADDTLWVNETFFREAEAKYGQLLSNYTSAHYINRELYKVEIDNLPIYGFGVKAFTLSMIEAALEITDRNASMSMIEEIIKIGKDMLQKPVDLLPGVEDTLEALHGSYRLVLATKGDLLDQETKLQKSGLTKYFHHIEVLSDKKEQNYQGLISHLDIKPSEFLMIGNSLKSDVLPILELGGHAMHIPFHTTWDYEKVDHEVVHDNLEVIESLNECLNFLL